MTYPPAQTGTVRTDEAVLDAPDGPMDVFVARADSPEPLPGVVVLIEAFGLVGSINDFAKHLAGTGYVAVVPDLFYREAPDNTAAYHDIPKGMSLQTKLVARGADFLGDVAVALDWMDGSPDVAPGPYGVVGFCMGGTLAFATAQGLGDRVAAAACFYGARISDLVARGPGITGRVLLVYGDRDPYIPPEEVSAVRSGLESAGIRYDLSVYAGADHGFMNDARPEVFHPEAAGDAWSRLLGFLEEMRTPAAGRS